MPIRSVRTANIVLVFLIIASGHLYCLWYVGAMHISLEVLNSQKIYLQHSYKIYNLVFWAYELVLAERLLEHHMPESFEWLLNSAEHIGFGIVICLKIYIYTAIFIKQQHQPRWKRGLLAFALFNAIGVFNEIFQHFLSHRSLFVFSNDSLRDIQMNFVGGLVFLLTLMIKVCWLKYYSSRPHYSSL